MSEKRFNSVHLSSTHSTIGDAQMYEMYEMNNIDDVDKVVALLNQLNDENRELRQTIESYEYQIKKGYVDLTYEEMLEKESEYDE